MGLTTAQSAFDLISEIAKASKNIDNPEVTFADDPIALSWASYHVWKKFPGRRWVDLKDVEAYPHDREIAAATRRYYRDRYTMQVLRGHQMTEFQTKLYGIITGEQPILRDQMGILMKIPYFYVEDVMIDQIFSTTKPADRTISDKIPQSREEVITPYEYVFSSRRGSEMHQYWFTDSQGRATLWSVQTGNPLASLVRSIYERRQPMRIRANWHWGSIRGPHRDRLYWHINNVELA